MGQRQAQDLVVGLVFAAVGFLIAMTIIPTRRLTVSSKVDS